MDIYGDWYNELKSHLFINKVVNGQFTGNYETAVSSGCAKGSYLVIGRTDTDAVKPGEAVGFVVLWANDQSNCKSVTAWSGQAQTIDGEEKIIALWLLTTETDPDKDWTSTLIGQDVFTRNKPTVKLATMPKVLLKSHP